MGLFSFLDSKAIKKYQAALETNPGDPAAHFSLAVAYEEKGRARDAIREFEETLKLNPTSAEAHFNLGVLYESIRDGKNATLHILKAGNLFGQKNDAANKDRARIKLRQYYQKFGLKAEDLNEKET